MDWIDSEWEVISPMFLHGYDNRSVVELRAPPIKSIMRYWWRALHGHLEIRELYTEEAAIFGSADDEVGKSSFQLRILPHKNISTGDYKLVTHKKKSISKGIKPGVQFKIRIQTHKNVNALRKYFLLLYLSLTLGGLGQRVRRGAGALKFLNLLKSSIKIEFNFERDIIEILNDIIEEQTDLNYLLNNTSNRIELRDERAGSKFPYIISIMIGREFNSWRELREKIDSLCHDLKENNKNNYNSMGFAYGRKKLASPLYISMIREHEKYYPIMTKLNPEFPRNFTPPKNINLVPEEFINNLS